MAIILALVIFPLAALILSGGLNLLDHRKDQLAADAGALAGASSIGILPASSVYADVLTQTQTYAWSNFGLLASSQSCSTPTGDLSPHGYVETCSGNGYTVTATYPDYNQLGSHLAYSAYDTVAVDIVHSVSSGLSALLGQPTVTIRVHAAAEAEPADRKFPFAIATRFLTIQGSGSVSLYGAALIGACSDNGKGDFTDHNVNGGVYFNGGTSMTLGAAMEDSVFTSPQAILMADPNDATCTEQSNNAAELGYSGVGGDNVSFDASAPNYNYDWAYNSGPSGCNESSTATPTACENPPDPTDRTAAPDYNTFYSTTWMDQCWKNGGSDAPISTSTPSSYYDADTNSFVTSSSPAVECSPGQSSGYPSYEGTSTYSDFPLFPEYQDPETLVDTGGYSVPSATAVADGNTPSADKYNASMTVPCSGTVTPGSTGGYVFTSYGCSDRTALTFEPGWYVFQFDQQMLFDKSSAGITCDSSGAHNIANLSGCVFIFRDGASFQVSSSGGLYCAAVTGQGGGCSFEFEDSGDPQATYTNGNSFYATNSPTVNLTPIPYVVTTSGGPVTYHYPVIYSNGSSDCLNTSHDCAVYITQPSNNTPIEGTIFVPFGIVYLGANATAATGQVIADTVRMQAGASASSTGIAYRGSTDAPVPGSAVLIE